MNTKLNRIALTLGGALFAGAAFAGGGPYPIEHAEAATAASPTTRAEVQAELKSAPSLIRGDAYPVLEATVSHRTREEVRAEVRARPIEVKA